MTRHSVEYTFISAPDERTMAILSGKMRNDMRKKLKEKRTGAVALIQDRIPDIIYYTDLAVKASDVEVAEIVGSCPQTLATIAILGEVEAVRAAVERILEETQGK